MSFVKYHPVFLALEGKKILIVGAGFVGLEKLESLLPTGADITVLAPWASPEVLAWHEEGRLQYRQGVFTDDDAEGYFMVIAATNVPEVNARVFQIGDQMNRLSNSVDDPVNCNFIMSAITKHGPMQVAVSSAGCSPALAQRLRKKIATDLLTEEMGVLADFLGSWRPKVKETLEGYKVKQAFWEGVIDSHIPKVLREEGWDHANREMDWYLQGFSTGKDLRFGRVILIGAGPGDPDLMTIKGMKALESADVVLYDRLTNSLLLRHAKSTALLTDVGKAPGECGRPRQEVIHALMIEHARAGRVVARLKGGDPFVFGRGGEEIEALREANIPYEVVPGVSSSIAAASAAEIPVTHRGLATGFAVFTAQGASLDVDTVPWESVRHMPTLVLLMGVEKLPDIVAKLRSIGRSEDLPIAVISHATLPTQQIVVGSLADIAARARNLPSPATIVVGEVVRLAKTLEPLLSEWVAS